MLRKIEITGDGSTTVWSGETGETYHSRFGAIEESRHIYIEAGLKHYLKNHNRGHINILEIGFGTGLNALLTCLYSIENQLNIYYEAIELFPLTDEEYRVLNYPYLAGDKGMIFPLLHQSPWETENKINEYFSIKKVKAGFTEYHSAGQYEIIYYDPFSPASQPGLWTPEILQKTYHLLGPGGLLVTYCSKGEVRRNLLSAGFEVEKIPGPKGKREIIRARKPG